MYTVSVVKGGNHRKMLKEAITLCGNFSAIFSSNSERILIKPNFGCHKTALTGATTDLRVLASLIELLQDEGYSKIVVGDGGMAGYIQINILRYLGVTALCKKYGVPVLDLNRDEGVHIKLTTGANIKISKTALESRVLNLAKLKTHVLTTVTLGIKNLMGCVVGFDKREIHLHGLHESLANLSLVVKPCFTIIEGLIGMEGRGPVTGKPIKTDTIIASKDTVAADIIASKTMGFDPFSIKHIRHAINIYGESYNMDKIKVVGTPLTKAITPFERGTPKRLEANPYINKLKHAIRGTPPSRLAYALLSSKSGFNFFRGLGILQEEIDHEPLTHPPKVYKDMCKGCAYCKIACPVNAISIQKEKADISHDKCVKCYCCIEICPYGAIAD